MKIKGILLGVLVFVGQAGIWRIGGSPLIVQPGDQTESKILVTSSGDFYVVYQDKGERPWQCFVRRFDKEGEPLWSPIKVCESEGFQRRHQAVITSSGELIVVLEDNRKEYDILQVYISKIGINGEYKWNSEGIALSPANSNQYTPQLCLSEEGCFITWTDYRPDSIGNSPTIWCSYVTTQGQVAWTKMVGFGVAIGGGPVGGPAIAPTDDKAVIFWENYIEPEPRIFCQVVDSAGKIYFSPGGKSLHTGLFPPTQDPATNDSTNAFIIFLSNATRRNVRNLQSDPRGQKIKDTLFLWDPNGFQIISVNSYPRGFALAPDFNGGLFICWGKYNRYKAPDLYIQSIRTDTTLRYAEEGLKVWENYSTDSDDYIWMKAIGDGFGGIVVTWDTHSDSTIGDIMANRIDTLGHILWGNGIKICEGTNNQIHPQICRVDSNFIIVWQDKRSGNWDLYAQCLDLNGNVGIGEKHRIETQRPIALQICPNPSNRFIDIKFQLPVSGYTTLKIYDVLGQEVRILARGQKGSGYYSLLWDRRDNSGKTVPSGVYLWELKVRGKDGSLRVVRKTVLIKQRRDYE